MKKIIGSMDDKHWFQRITGKASNRFVAKKRVYNKQKGYEVIQYKLVKEVTKQFVSVEEFDSLKADLEASGYELDFIS